MSLRRFGELLVLVVSNPGPCTGDFAESTRRFCTESIAHIFCSDFLPDSDKEAVLLFLKSTVAEIAALQSRREAERQCAKTIAARTGGIHRSSPTNRRADGLTALPGSRIEAVHDGHGRHVFFFFFLTFICFILSFFIFFF